MYINTLTRTFNIFLVYHTILPCIFYDVSGEPNQKLQTMSAHKYMLESSSPVFWSMLNGELAKTEPIKIEDVSHEIFAAILR